MGSSSSSAAAYTTRIVKNWRENPPSSYSLKIHNFSQLENLRADSDQKYQSNLFSSGGYDWSLIVYPKGNEKDNGSGFISTYVEIDGTSLVSKPQTDVFAELSFFVYNKKENKYFTIQDAEVKRFNALTMVWGLQQVLPLDTFKNLENGYLFDGDQCEFGVNVIVAAPLTNWEILSFNEKFVNPKFSWTVENFSKLKDFQTSDSFPMGGKNWYLRLYPKGDSRANGKCLSVFLYLSNTDTETLKANESIYAKAHIRVLDPVGSNNLTRKISDWYNKSNSAWGWDKFLCLKELGKIYLDKEDSLKVEIEFEVVSGTNYSPMI